MYLPGTCGELVQGIMRGRHFLISCPIDLYARVTVDLFANGGRVVAPPEFPKAESALRMALAHLNLRDVVARLRIDSPIPRSKGMGSSTADVAGAIYALAQAVGRAITPAEVARLAIAVEPTNGSLFPNLAVFDHRQGSIYDDLGPAPPAAILVLDCGGEVDTLSYNAVDRTALLVRLSPLAERALALTREGIRRGDLEEVGEGATLSALAHQAVLPKAPLAKAVALGKELGGLGVCVGHSGTVIGVFFPPERHGDLDVADRFRAALPTVAMVGWHRLVDGGCYSSPLGAPAVAELIRP